MAENPCDLNQNGERKKKKKKKEEERLETGSRMRCRHKRTTVP